MNEPDRYPEHSGRTGEAREARETGDGHRAVRGASREGGAPPPWRTGRDREQDAWAPGPQGGGSGERSEEDGPEA